MYSHPYEINITHMIYHIFDNIDINNYDNVNINMNSYNNNNNQSNTNKNDYTMNAFIMTFMLSHPTLICSDRAIQMHEILVIFAGSINKGPHCSGRGWATCV